MMILFYFIIVVVAFELQSSVLDKLNPRVEDWYTHDLGFSPTKTLSMWWLSSTLVDKANFFIIVLFDLLNWMVRVVGIV